LSDILGTKNKFQADKAKLDTTAYAPTIASGQQQAADNTKFNNVFGQQQNLAGQYGQVAAGQGPNPAKEMLRQQTGQNVNMAQGQAASQRGVNPALAARMAVDASAGQNQQAAGQGATMQAQQSLAAMGQQAGVLGQMQQGANTQQGLGVNLLGTAGGLQNQQNNANIANTLGTNQINAGVASQNAATNAAMVGGLMNAAGGAATMGMMADGGMVPEAEAPEMNMDYGGLVPAMAGGGIAEEPVSPLHGYLDSLEAQVQPAPQPQGYAYGGMEGFPVQPTLGGPGALQAPAMRPQFAMPQAPTLAQPMENVTTSFSPTPGEGNGASSPPPAKAGVKPGPYNAFGDLKNLGTGAYDRFAHMGMPVGLQMAEGGEVPVDEEMVAGTPVRPRGTYYQLYHPSMVRQPIIAGPDPMVDFLPYSAPGLLMDAPGSMGAEISRNVNADLMAEKWNKAGMTPGDVAGFSNPGQRVDPALLGRAKEMVRAERRPVRPQKHSAGGPVPMDFVGGGHVPGQAQVQGDSSRNDTVPALLSPGEAVVPRSVMDSPNAPAEAAAFIEHLLRRRGGPSFDKAMAARGGRKMAEGGEVKPTTSEASPSLTDAVTGWWKARGTPEQEQHGRNVDEALNALLPSMVSGRKALQAKRASLKAVDEATKE
jgi:hypothetical protein